MHDAGIVELGCRGETADRLALALAGLDEVDVRLRQRDREDEAREARSRTDVRDRSCGSELGNLQAGQAVGYVRLERCSRLGDGRRRVRLRGEVGEQALEPVGRTRR
jgi:hypothetical protein